MSTQHTTIATRRLMGISPAKGQLEIEIRIGQPYERHFRDAHTLLQHSDKSSPRYASAGRLMFGLDNDWVWLSF